jgi:hypothetical protein
MPLDRIGFRTGRLWNYGSGPEWGREILNGPKENKKLSPIHENLLSEESGSMMIPAAACLNSLLRSYGCGPAS